MRREPTVLPDRLLRRLRQVRHAVAQHDLGVLEARLSETRARLAHARHQQTATQQALVDAKLQSRLERARSTALVAELDTAKAEIETGREEARSLRDELRRVRTLVSSTRAERAATQQEPAEAKSRYRGERDRTKAASAMAWATYRLVEHPIERWCGKLRTNPPSESPRA